uniref:Peptidase S1 domain-containing protein n=1 Tax=Panagrolaimus sp. ES5 TaxID=591445 RepID=A0AC34F488_9BILA
MLNIIIVALVLATVSLPVFAVEGGQKTSVEKYPFLAQLTIKKPNGHTGRCSGSIIAQQFVVSTYHCIHKREFDEKYALDNTLVITGTSDAYNSDNPSGVVHKIEKFYHKQNVSYDSFLGIEDILIIKVCGFGDTAWFAGIGTPKGQLAADYFREGETKIVQAFLDNYIYDNSVVYGVSGDSGGPLFSKVNNEWILHGLIPSNGQYSPRISYFCDWIKEVTDNELDC